METIALRVEPDVAAHIRDEAQRQGVPLSTVGRELLVDGIESRRGLPPDDVNAIEAFRASLVGLDRAAMRRATLVQIEEGVGALKRALAEEHAGCVTEGRALCVDSYLRHGTVSIEAARKSRPLDYDPLMQGGGGGVWGLCHSLAHRIGCSWRSAHEAPADVRASIEAELGLPVPVNRARDLGWPTLTAVDTAKLENGLHADPRWRADARRIHDRLHHLRQSQSAWRDWLGATRLRFVGVTS